MSAVKQFSVRAAVALGVGLVMSAVVVEPWEGVSLPDFADRVPGFAEAGHLRDLHGFDPGVPLVDDEGLGAPPPMSGVEIFDWYGPQVLLGAVLEPLTTWGTFGGHPTAQVLSAGGASGSAADAQVLQVATTAYSGPIASAYVVPAGQAVGAVGGTVGALPVDQAPQGPCGSGHGEAVRPPSGPGPGKQVPGKRPPRPSKPSAPGQPGPPGPAQPDLPDAPPPAGSGGGAGGEEPPLTARPPVSPPDEVGDAPDETISAGPPAPATPNPAPNPAPNAEPAPQVLMV